jgi:hypothetical protein
MFTLVSFFYYVCLIIYCHSNKTIMEGVYYRRRLWAPRFYWDACTVEFPGILHWNLAVRKTNQCLYRDSSPRKFSTLEWTIYENWLNINTRPRL